MSFVRRTRSRNKAAEKFSVWAEPNKKGGHVIYVGVRGTDVKTFAGLSLSRDSLEYKMRQARVKFNLPVD